MQRIFYLSNIGLIDVNRHNLKGDDLDRITELIRDSEKRDKFKKECKNFKALCEKVGVMQHARGINM